LQPALANVRKPERIEFPLRQHDALRAERLIAKRFPNPFAIAADLEALGHISQQIQ